MKQTFINLDADESVFFIRQLTQTKAKTYDVKYPMIKARLLLPMSQEAGPGAEFIRYEQFDMVGMAKIVSSYAHDFPRADVRGKEFISPVRSLGDSYGYSIQDIRAAMMAGLPLNQRKANAAREAILRKEASIAYFGDSETGLGGFLSNPNISEVSLPNDGSGGSTFFLDKTPDQVLRDLNSLVTKVITVSKGVEAPNSILFPPSIWAFVSTLRLPYSDSTVLEFFLKNSPSVKNADWLPELETAGDGSLPRIVVYDRNPDKLTLEVPQDFEQFPPQEKGMEYEIPCHSRIGGVLIYYPLSVAFTDDAGAVS